VFDNTQPRTQVVLQEVAEQLSLWAMAGARGLGSLLHLSWPSVVVFLCFQARMYKNTNPSRGFGVYPKILYLLIQ